MRRSLAVTAGAVLLAVACRNPPETPAKPPAQRVDTVATMPADLSGADVATKIDLVPDVLQSAAVGTQRNADGAAVDEAGILPPNVPLFLTMAFRSSPPELQVAARWLDAQGNEVAVERRAANGEPTVTLALDKGLPPGSYKVEGYWGGNIVFERDLKVAK